MSSVLTFYSNIMVGLNCFRMTKTVNSALYLSNWLCFLGNLVIMLRNPYHLGYLTRDLTYFKTIPLFGQHLLNQAWHLLPIYIFRNRQSIQETVSPTSFLLSSLLFLMYLTLFSEQTIVDNYKLSKKTLLQMAVGVGLLFWVVVDAARLVL